jgi:hypothetical protein
MRIEKSRDTGPQRKKTGQREMKKAEILARKGNKRANEN